MSSTQILLSNVDAIISKTYDHSRGRPSKTDELQIERELRSYFLKNLSAKFTSQKTGYDIKTILRYFKKFKKDIAEQEGSDFIQRCKEENQRCALTYENLIDSFYQDIEDIDAQINLAVKTNRLERIDNLYRLKLKAKEQIANLVTAKTNLVNVPTADVIIEQTKGGKENEVQPNKMGKNS